MVTLKVDKETFTNIELNNSVVITDGKRRIQFMPNQLKVINSYGENNIHIEHVKNLKINM